MRVVAKTDNRTTNHRYKVVHRFSVDDETYYPSTASDVCGYIAADGQAIQAEYTTAVNFAAPHLRFWFAASNSAGAARESARITVYLVITFKS